MHENLRCMGFELPPHTVEVTEKLTKIDTAGAFSSDFIAQNHDPETNEGMVDYDIEIILPHSDYMIDAEMKSDFLTGNMRMQMFALDHESNSWLQIAKSYWFNENSFDDISIDADADMSTKVGDMSYVQKLRYMEDVPAEVLENASNLILRIRVSVQRILDTLTHFGLFEPAQDDLCFNFNLSLFIDEVGQEHLHDDSHNKLIRVDWHGKEISHGELDVTQRITAFLEFEKSISRHLPELKDGFQENLFMQPMLPDKSGPDMHAPHAKVSHIKLKQDSDDTLVINFSPYTLEKGTCYKLYLGDSPKGPGISHMHNNELSMMVAPQINESLDLHVCTTACDCDNLGTAECADNDEGQKICVCHPFFTGYDCSECVHGYYRNQDGYCEKSSTCVENGG